MSRKRTRIFLIIFIMVLITGYLLLKPVFNYISGYLSKSEQVKANILIVEGWLPDYALEMAYNEINKNGYDYIVATGMKSNKPYYKVYSNGYLIFYPAKFLSGINEVGPHTIEIDAFSELDGDNRAHFNLFVNDSLAADFYTDITKRKYGINFYGDLKKIDSVLVQFDNDSWGSFGDRNLYVKEIIFDHKISVPYLNNSEYDIINLDGQQRIVNNINSNAEFAREKLITLGIDPSRITSVSAERVRINRTLTSALAFRDWIRMSNKVINGINIISQGTHARRTWMTYNKILDEKYKIGIISLPDNTTNNYSKSETLRTLREILGIIYYWFILLPF